MTHSPKNLDKIYLSSLRIRSLSRKIWQSLIALTAFFLTSAVQFFRRLTENGAISDRNARSVISISREGSGLRSRMTRAIIALRRSSAVSRLPHEPQKAWAHTQNRAHGKIEMLRKVGGTTRRLSGRGTDWMRRRQNDAGRE